MITTIGMLYFRIYNVNNGDYSGIGYMILTTAITITIPLMIIVIITRVIMITVMIVTMIMITK